MKCDVAIYGAGAAGLWIANRLESIGARTLIFEEAAVGGGQTINSQGVIHTGAKYLRSGDGQFSAAGLLWKRAFDGQHSVDLQAVTVLSEHQHILIQRDPLGLGRRLVETFMHLSAIKTTTLKDGAELAQLPCQAGFEVVRVAERTICTASLVQALSRPLSGKIIHGRILGFVDTDEPDTGSSIVEINGRLRRIEAEAHVCALGHGNAELLRHARIERVVLRTRTFRQMVIRGDLPDFFGVAVSRCGLPTIVITSHRAPNHDGNIWYVGGRLAEQPLERLSSAELHDHVGKALVTAGFDVDWPACNLEIHQARYTEARPCGLKWHLGLRNRGPLLRTAGNIHFAWPNKLACVPLLAEQVAEAVNANVNAPTVLRKVQPRGPRSQCVRALPPWHCDAAAQNPPS